MDPVTNAPFSTPERLPKRSVSPVPVPEKSSLKKDNHSRQESRSFSLANDPTSPKNSYSIRFSESVNGKLIPSSKETKAQIAKEEARQAKKEKQRALLEANKTKFSTLSKIDSSEASPLSEGSRHSNHSQSSGGSANDADTITGSVQNAVTISTLLQDIDDRPSILSDSGVTVAHTIVNNEIHASIKQHIQNFTKEFSQTDNTGKKFVAHILKKHFYNKTKINTTTSVTLTNINDIRRIRNEQLNTVTQLVEIWLHKISLFQLFNFLRDWAIQVYPFNSFEYRAFEMHLFFAVVNLDTLLSDNFVKADDIRAEIATDFNKHLASNKKKLEIIDNLTPKDPFYKALFQAFLLNEHTRIFSLPADDTKSQEIFTPKIENCARLFSLETASIEARRIPQAKEITQKIAKRYYLPQTLEAQLFGRYLINTRNYIFFDEENPIFDEKIIQHKTKFEYKLKIILDTFHAPIPLWQTWYLLWFHGSELFEQENPNALTLEKYKPLYVTSNQNIGQSSILLKERLLEELPADLSSCYFKQDPKTNKRTFADLEDIQREVALLKYNPYRLCFSTFYHEARETLKVFARKDAHNPSKK